jgi:hypothetical protein
MQAARLRRLGVMSWLAGPAVLNSLGVEAAFNGLKGRFVREA